LQLVEQIIDARLWIFILDGQYTFIWYHPSFSQTALVLPMAIRLGK